jgi:hypothetical protein
MTYNAKLGGSAVLLTTRNRLRKMLGDGMWYFSEDSLRPCTFLRQHRLEHAAVL